MKTLRILFIFPVGSFASLFDTDANELVTQTLWEQLQHSLSFFLCINFFLQAEILSLGSFLEQNDKIRYPDKIRGFTLVE